MVKESRAQLPNPLTREARLLATLRLQKGQPFPALRVQQRNGTETLLMSLIPKGHRALINLWATWCVPCAKEMPELDRLHPQFKANKLVLIGLSIDTDGVAVVRDYLRKRPVRYPVVKTDESGIEKIFNADQVTVPLSVLLDEQGRVETVYGSWSVQTARALQALCRKRENTGE